MQKPLTMDEAKEIYDGMLAGVDANDQDVV